ncbi:MAG: phosphatidylserine decarboxylase, partial [Candidatus Electrothrix sp. AR4]|nr:phosphatidylserine decarboxylase [Candidatus Electrothrix sp. AR4]
DNNVIVSPADSTVAGWWQIGNDVDSNIYVQGAKNGIVESKGIQWSIRELLKDSVYADRFKGGIFCHMFLNSIDYHRWHTPVQGKVVEARVIQGQCYLDVNVAQTRLPDDTVVNILNALDGTGYQFVQTRGLIVIDSPIGLVACLPMGMAQVSSVVITAEEGVTLQKGEELGYFQFGGSDWVIVFERASNVQLIAQPNVHYNQGTWIGNAYPYSIR